MVPSSIYDMAEEAKSIVSLGNAMGEGWFLTAEMIELIHNGAPNIICVQPFACLPNHVTGKGMIKEIRNQYPESNIVAIDYDPGASEVNQLNRIKLMISTAIKNEYGEQARAVRELQIAKAHEAVAKDSDHDDPDSGSGGSCISLPQKSRSITDSIKEKGSKVAVKALDETAKVGAKISDLASKSANKNKDDTLSVYH